MTAPTPAPSSDRGSGRATERVAPRQYSTEGSAGQVRVAAMVDGKLRESEGAEALQGLAALLATPDAAVWVDLAGPTVEQVESVGAALGLHHLVVEDVLEGNQRAKIETTDGVIHIVLFALDRNKQTAINEVDIVLGLGFLLTVHDPAWEPRSSHHLHSGLATILAHGPDHLLWAISDDIVDGYFPYVDELGDELDTVQDAVITKSTPDALDRLFALKRELIVVRRAASPTREVFNQLTNRDLTLIDPEELVYFRDIYDHLIRLTDELDNFRELASSTLDVYLTQVNNNLSVIVKRLTGVTVIVAGIGAVAGLFGMSEAGIAVAGTAPTGFWVVVLGSLVAGSVAAVVLRRIGWI